MRLLLAIAAVFFWLTFLRAASPPEPAGSEDGVYVYDLFRGAPKCPELLDRLKALPLRSTLILSLEQGREFVLDRPDGEEQVSCVLGYLTASGHKAKAMLLQDPVFLERGEEAIRRATLVSAYATRHAGQLSGVQLDVEPYTVEKWDCCGADERRDLMRGLQQLLTRVRRQLHGLALGVIAPWWYPVVRELPEAGPESLFQVADEIYLMAYGDEGGPVVGGTAERVLARVDAPEFFTGRGRLYIALATYEFRSPDQFQAELETIRRRLASRPTFGGTAVFYAAGPFNVPLMRLLSGTITDSGGRPLPDVEVEASGVRGKSNVCGVFFLRGIPNPRSELTLHKPGYQTKKLSLELAAPGAIKELGKIVLEKEQAAAR